MEAADNKSNIVININGGTVQVQPNVTTAVQNFYNGCIIQRTSEAPYCPERSVEDTAAVSEDGETVTPTTPVAGAVSPLSLYIDKEDVLNAYAARLAECSLAADIALVVVDMVNNPEVKVDKTIMVKERFIKVVRQLAVKADHGVSICNIRAQINKAWERWRITSRSGVRP